MKKNYLVHLALICLLFSCNSKSTKDTRQKIKEQTPLVSSNAQTKTDFTASDVYSHSKSAIVLILTFDENQIPLSQGSGFFIDEKTVVTNYHVIEGASQIKIKPIGSSEPLSKALLVKASQKHDIAIIETSNQSNFLKIDTATQAIGEKIFAIGNPNGLEGTISEGIVSGIRNSEFDIIQITAPISPGSSGGPVINEKGDVIGISTFTLLNSQNLNFAVPVKYISLCSSFVPTKRNERKPTKIQSKAGVVLSKFNKESSEFYEQVSLKNTTNDMIRNIVGVLIYRDMKNELIDFKIINPDIIIPPGLAKMLTQRSFDQSQRYHYYKTNTGGMPSYMFEMFKVDFRLLSYDIVQ